jgi:hypothetical protein
LRKVGVHVGNHTQWDESTVPDSHFQIGEVLVAERVLDQVGGALPGAKRGAELAVALELAGDGYNGKIVAAEDG